MVETRENLRRRISLYTRKCQRADTAYQIEAEAYDILQYVDIRARFKDTPIAGSEVPCFGLGFTTWERPGHAWASAADHSFVLHIVGAATTGRLGAWRTLDSMCQC